MGQLRSTERDRALRVPVVEARPVQRLHSNPDYWQSGLPYLNELQLVSIPDPTARFDALFGGEVDGMESLSYAQATSLRHTGQAVVLQGNRS